MKETKKNYMVIDNIIFCIKFAMERQPGFITALVISGLCWGAYPLIISFLPKIIIDMIQNKTSINQLIVILVLLTVALVIIGLIDDKVHNSQPWRFLHTKMGFIEMRMKKAFSMDYKNLENPEILNLMDRARFATEGENDGVNGIYNNISCTARNMLTVTVTIGAVGIVNPLIVLLVIFLSFISYQILKITKVENQKKYTWAMPPYWRKIAYMNDFTNDFAYAKDIRIYGMRNFINRKNKEINNEAHVITKRMFNRWILCSTGMNGVFFIQNIILYGWLIYSVLCNNMTLGNFALYIGIINEFCQNVTQIFDVIADNKRLSLEIDDYRNFLEYSDEEYDECIEAKKLRLNTEEYEFYFENVSFKYPGQEKYALENINITIVAGEKLAIVGMNGAGKTTFIKLLLRLYEPTAGRILLNGIDVRRYDKKEYYKVFAPVFQDVQCFAMSIKQNISMKLLEDTDNEKIEECLKKSELDEKVGSLELKEDTELLKIFHSNGIDLSGGEKQKLMLARALYKGADVFILDEPTAALDALAENRMYKQFDEIVQGKTSIYISHRLASTRFCDRVAMFENGHIVEIGTHEELLQNNMQYRKMYDVQSQYYKEETLDE